MEVSSAKFAVVFFRWYGKMYDMTEDIQKTGDKFFLAVG